MALTQGKLSQTMQDFVTEVNKMPVDDQAKAIKAYCDKLEASVYEAIKEITIVIPSGVIQVQGSPSAQTNITPITIDAKSGSIIK
jgi:hypothetical protein